jgi:hypothetical protein
MIPTVSSTPRSRGNRAVVTTRSQRRPVVRPAGLCCPERCRDKARTAGGSGHRTRPTWFRPHLGQELVDAAIAQRLAQRGLELGDTGFGVATGDRSRSKTTPRNRARPPLWSAHRVGNPRACYEPVPGPMLDSKARQPETKPRSCGTQPAHESCLRVFSPAVRTNDRRSPRRRSKKLRAAP